MAPDLGYYFPYATFAVYKTHTLIRSVTFCLPAGALLLLLAELYRRPFAYALPSPDREVVAGASSLLDLKMRPWWRIPVSLYIGIWTHLAWDALTHQKGWVVQHFSPLQLSIGRGLRVFYALQILSSIAGLWVLGWFYRRYLLEHSLAASRANYWSWRTPFWLVVLGLAGTITYRTGVIYKDDLHYSAIENLITYIHFLLEILAAALPLAWLLGVIKRRIWAPAALSK